MVSDNVAVSGGHTPGRWRAVGTENAWQVVADCNALVAEMPLCWSDDGDPCIEADARLIAAAPDMLEALSAAESLFNHTFAMDGTVHKQIRAAIARTKTGEGE